MQVKSQLALPQRLISTWLELPVRYRSPISIIFYLTPLVLIEEKTIARFLVVSPSTAGKKKKKTTKGNKQVDRKLTRVGHELEGSAEIAVAGRRAGAHVEDVGGERRETFDIGVSGGRLDDPVASLVLVLRR